MDGNDGSGAEGQIDYSWLQRQLAAAGLNAEGGGPEAWFDPSDGLVSAIFELCEDGCGDPPKPLEELLSKLPPAAEGAPVETSAFNINTPGPDGDSALHIAALYGQLPCVKALLAAGASPHIVNQADGSTVLHDAVAGGYGEIAELVLSGKLFIKHSS